MSFKNLSIALVDAKLAVHQLQQLNSKLRIEVERLREENGELNTENESMSLGKNIFISSVPQLDYNHSLSVKSFSKHVSILLSLMAIRFT